MKCKHDKAEWIDDNGRPYCSECGDYVDGLWLTLEECKAMFAELETTWVSYENEMAINVIRKLRDVARRNSSEA